MSEQMQHPHSPTHLYSEFNFHSGPHFIKPIPIIGPKAQWKRLNGKCGRYVLRSMGINLAGGDEHESDWFSIVEKLKWAIVVWESAFVRVFNWSVLWESEIDGGAVVGDGKGGELDGGDGDFGMHWFEKGEVENEDDEDEED